MKMKIWLLLIATMLVLSLGMVSAVGAGYTLTITRPAANAYMQGSYLVNASVTNTTPYVGGGDNCTQVQFFRGTTNFGNVSNPTGFSTSAATSYANVTLDTAGLEDISAYSITAKCINVTGSTVLATSAAVSAKVDNTKPTCSLDTTHTSGLEYEPLDTWAMTTTNANSCTYAFDANSYSRTVSSNACSMIERVPSTMYGTITLTATDGYNTTTCQTLTGVNIVKANQNTIVGAVVLSNQEQTSTVAQQQQKASQSSNGLVAIAVIALLVYVVSQNGKKK